MTDRTDRTEAAVAADVIVALLHANILPRDQRAPSAAAKALGIDPALLAAAAERYADRDQRPRTFNTLPYVYDANARPAPAPRPAAPAPQPALSPAPRPPAPPRPPQPRPSIGDRLDAVRNGFYLPTGEYVAYLAATVADHRARAEWLYAAAGVVAAAAEWHEECATIIENAGVRFLADLPEPLRPSPLALTAAT